MVEFKMAVTSELRQLRLSLSLRDYLEFPSEFVEVRVVGTSRCHCTWANNCQWQGTHCEKKAQESTSRLESKSVVELRHSLLELSYNYILHVHSCICRWYLRTAAGK